MPAVIPELSAQQSALVSTETVKELIRMRKWVLGEDKKKLSDLFKRELDYRVGLRDQTAAFVLATSGFMNSIARQYIDSGDFQPTIHALPYNCFTMDYNYVSPAMATIAFENSDILPLIIKHPLFYANEANDEGFTPLHIAAYHQQPYATQMLLDAGADPFQKISNKYPLTAYDLFPDFIKLHPSYIQHEKENARVEARAKRRLAFAENQEKLKRLAAGLPAELPPEEIGRLKELFNEEVKEDEEAPVVQDDPRKKLLEALMSSGSQEIVTQYIALMAQEEGPAQAIVNVLDKINAVTFDKLLVQYENDFASFDKGMMHYHIKNLHRDDLLQPFNHRMMPSKKFISEIDYNRTLMLDTLETCLTKADEGAALVEVMKQNIFTLNLQHALGVYGDRMTKQQLNKVSEHMSTLNRPDMVQVISSYQKNSAGGTRPNVFRTDVPRGGGAGGPRP